MGAPGLDSKRCWVPAALLVATAAAYSRTLAVPWYFDDIPVIVDNSSLRDLAAAAAGFLAPRGPVDLTFALNFRLHGLEVAGYHLVNIALHLGNGVLLYFLLRRVFRERPVQQFAALAIFLLHPVQTQAVTYVVQRYTLAAAFGALSALLLLARWGEERGFPFRTPRATAAYVSALLLGALAVLCKQNTATLFLLIPSFCVLFVGREWSRGDRVRLLLLPFALVPLLEGLRQLVLPLVTGASLGEITGVAAAADAAPRVSPILYFVTQWKVVWIYLRLLVLPYGQALDYGYPVATEVLTLGNIAAASGVCALLVMAWSVRRKYPRTSFGIAWFFAFLLVESTFIPLDPVFEHRLYLPIVGFAIVVADWLPKLPGRKVAVHAAGWLALLLGVLTWQRNALWLSPARLLTDNAESHPGNARILAGAANALAAEGAGEKARDLFRQGFARGLRHEAMYIGLMALLVAEGEAPEAIRTGEEGLRLYPSAVDILYLLGAAEDLRGDHLRAAGHFLRAIAIHPEREQGYNNLGASLDGQGRWAEAALQYGRAVEINPLYAVGHYNLGRVLQKLGRPVEAEVELDLAYRLGWDAIAGRAGR